MVLHTIVSAYDLFYEGEQPRTESSQPEYLQAGTNAYLWGCRQPDGFRIDRVVSTNPKDYLSYCPGMIFSQEETKASFS